MSPTAPPRVEARRAGEFGFTLTEMVAGLLVAAMLVSGLGEITRQFARATVRVNADLAATRGLRAAEAAFLAVERAEPGAVTVSADDVVIDMGAGERIEFRLTGAANGRRVLTWAGGARTVGVPANARFETAPDGVVVLRAEEGAPPLLVAAPRIEAPFDCRYDVVARRCR